MRRSISLVLILVIVGSQAFGGIHEVVLDHVTNSLNDTLLRAGEVHEFQLRYRNLETDYHFSTGNGFRIYSGDGATWAETHAHIFPGFDTYFDQLFAPIYSIDGSGADTIGIGTVSLKPDGGLYPGFDKVAVGIVIGPTHISDHGKHICIDSCFFPPGGTWQWADMIASVNVIPTWSGPHCFTLCDCDNPDLPDEIKLACGGCVGTVGNVDCSQDQIVDIGDLTELIKYLFVKSVTLGCPLEANIDRDPDNLVDIGDVTRLIDYFWGSREPLGDCVP